MITKLNKEAFIKLAEAYSKQEKYENELKSSVLFSSRKVQNLHMFYWSY